MLLIDMGVILNLHELVFEGSLLNKKQLSIILDILLGFLDLMLILEVFLRNTIALIFSLSQSAL